MPFTITVRVTSAEVQSDGTIIATGIAATYTNASRVNLTPCVGVFGHDAATYQGQLIGQARDVKGDGPGPRLGRAAAPLIRSERST